MLCHMATDQSLTEPAFLVLTALAAEPLHGYAILEDIRETSGGSVKIHAGTLYAILDRLRSGGLIEVEREEIVQSRLRRYYRLTGVGATRLAEETTRMQRHAATASARLNLRTAGGAA
jgi:DNA-binding PadR family transcriptional regulator